MSANAGPVSMLNKRATVWVGKHTAGQWKEGA